ncbi:hypothetical protein C8R43DRAFT_844527, partial [Mycena crocata]
SIYTRNTEPFKPERVARILDEIEIGPDLTPAEREEVRAFITEFADIFALSVSEVRAVKDAVYAPRIPTDHAFPLRANQRPFTRPQNVDVNKQVDGLVAAGVLRPIEPHDIKC